ncbi:hypothetical protein GCM10009562_08380 [Nocardioides aquaticus]|nr:hypothetical protein [Nocardioides aquaticus]
MLDPLEVLGAHAAGVHLLLVAGPAGLDLLDVGVDLLLLRGQVGDLDPRVAGDVDEPGPGGLQRDEIGDLGQVGAAVGELVGLRVELLELEQLDLGGRVGLQGGLLVRFGGAGSCWGRAGVSAGRRPGRSRGR